MILIVESGSTKADWIGIDRQGKTILSTRTAGLNPSVLKNDILVERISGNSLIYENRDKVSHVYFYGAGVGVDTAKDRIRCVCNNIFGNSAVQIREDTYAAIYAVTTPKEPSIACILGTGSNCTYFDGENVEQRVISLGYIIMDEASGNFYGRQLIRAYYFNQLPSDLASKLSKQYDLRAEVIEKNLYRKENPNVYMAKFGRFVIENKHEPILRDIILDGLRRFTKHQILQFEDCKEVAIHFIGTVAFYLADEIKEVLKEYGLTLGNIVRRPIDRLVQYHIDLLNQTV